MDAGRCRRDGLPAKPPEKKRYRAAGAADAASLSPRVRGNVQSLGCSPPGLSPLLLPAANDIIHEAPFEFGLLQLLLQAILLRGGMRAQRDIHVR